MTSFCAALKLFYDVFKINNLKSELLTHNFFPKVPSAKLGSLCESAWVTL